MTEESASNCLFCKIVSGEIGADLVLQTDRCVAFRDVNPQAPTHVLVIPRRHEPDVVSLLRAAPEDVSDLFATVGRVAEQEGAAEGYRTVFNTGARAQQSVFHAHVHVLAGRDMTWPPG